jgi:hypothetical protein
MRREVGVDGGRCCGGMKEWWRCVIYNSLANEYIASRLLVNLLTADCGHMLSSMFHDTSTTSTTLMWTVALLRLKTKGFSKLPSQELPPPALGDFQHGRIP